MKIILVTPIRKEAADPHLFWVRALRQLQHRVKLFALTGRSRLVNSWRLFQTINRWRPDEVFFSAGRDACLPVKDTVFFCGVPPRWLSRSERTTGRLAKLVVVNDDRHLRQWRRLGVKKLINLPISAVDAAAFRPRRLKRIIPVSFVGSLFRDRQWQLVRIAGLFPALKVWGWLPPGVRLTPGLKHCYQGEVWGDKLVKIYQQSLIGLNLSPTHMVGGGNLRPFEICASGALLLSDQLNPDWFRDKKDTVGFHSSKDCAQKINFYLSHRPLLNKISRAGRRRTLRQHTYRRRFTNLLKYLRK